MRIMDRDIEVWAATVKANERALRMAPPCAERRYRRQLAAARKALAAMVEYRTVFDEEQAKADALTEGAPGLIGGPT